MRFTAARGRTLAWVLAILIGGAVNAPAQQPPVPPTPVPAPTQTAPPAAAPPNPAARQFTGDTGVILNLIKPDKTADFEAVLARVKEALTRSADDKRKQQAAGWRMFRSADPGPGGTVVYLFWFEPAVKDADYSITKILQESFPTEVQELYTKLLACYADNGQSLMNLELRLSMGPATPGK